MHSDGFLDDSTLHVEILNAIKSGNYRITKHAAEQQKKRKIELGDILHVLKTGSHEKGKTILEHQFWKYAIRGKTENRKEIRVIIAFAEEMIIITAIKL